MTLFCNKQLFMKGEKNNIILHTNSIIFESHKESINDYLFA